MKVQLLFLQLFIYSTVLGQSFPCDGQLLIATSDGVTTTISRQVSIPFSPPFMSPFARYANTSFDALGFNSKDNFIYGVQQNTNRIVKLKSDNSFDTVGVISLIDTLKSNAGDCTPSGLFLCHDYELHQILVFEVVDSFYLRDRIDLFWDPSSSNSGVFKTRIFDFAIDPNNPTVAYTYQGVSEQEDLDPADTRGYMLQINLDLDDPNLGMVTPVELLDQGVVRHIGALVFSANSSLYAYGTSSTELYPDQNKLYAVDQFGGNASEILVNFPASAYSDGCSCPFSFSFSNQVPRAGIFCNNDVETFKLTINNNAFLSIEDVILRDTFPQGTMIKEVSTRFTGDISSGTGVGTNLLEITGLLIPGKSVVEIEIKIETIDAKVGSTYNQAFLQNLPARFKGVMGSDNLGTVGKVGDPSLFFIDARKLEDVSWRVIAPSDCIEAKDGMIVFSSPQFFPSQEFEIGLRNKKGWEETVRQVVIDQASSFVVDSLIPGNYQVFRLRSLSDNCSLALKDTTILLEAPHELLDLELSYNSPLCEGETLMLNSAVSPAAESIRWTGPEIFGSDTANAIIEDIETKRSGEFKVVAQYGFCTQTKLFDVHVKPQVKASISGKSEYCVRDTLKLLVKGEGQDLDYNWYGPHDLIAMDSVLLNAHVTDAESGFYEVIVSNGSCSDTAGIEVVILPTPTLSLEESIMSDFCDPISLSPVITGDSDVSYQWTPQEGLDCVDCPNPQIQQLVLSSYQLRVENERLCSDSSTIRINLDKDKLVYAPNVFQLASTSGNERFTIVPGCVTRYIHSLDIYNRWGNKVFSASANSADDTLDSWDGFVETKKGSHGVYIWFAKVELVDGTIQYLTGDVTLLE